MPGSGEIPPGRPAAPRRGSGRSVPLLLLAFLSLAAAAAGLLASLPADGQPRQAGQASPLKMSTVSYAGAEYLVAEADMPRVRMRMLSGAGLRSLHDAEAAARSHGERLLLAANGGLFDLGAPIGLHYEDGRPVRPLNLARVPPASGKPGNFYYLPNAVLYQDRAGRVAIRDSRQMAGHEDRVRDGLQSGPALLLDGGVHSVARPPNRGAPHARRLAACVPSPTRLVIVFAERPTTFPQLAGFLQRRLGCRDAVFLDAEVTGIYVPGGNVDVAPSSFAGVLTLTGTR
jgi:uncharacterized protein YigE (DUF2233 family)